MNLPIDFMLLFHTRNPALKRSRLPALQLTPAPRTSEWAPSQELSFEAPEVARQTLFSHKHPRLPKFFLVKPPGFFCRGHKPKQPHRFFLLFYFSMQIKRRSERLPLPWLRFQSSPFAQADNFCFSPNVSLRQNLTKASEA